MALGDGAAWNEALPDNDQPAHQIDDYDRDLRVGVRGRMAREHIWPASQAATNEGGHHNFITFQSQTAAPTIAGTTAGGVWVGTDTALYFTNSAAVDVVIVGSGASRVSAITEGTLGSLVICSSASPTTLTTLAASVNNYVLVTHSATGAPTWMAVSPLVSGVVGAVSSLSNNTVYQAATDGFVTAYDTVGTGGSTVEGFSDGSNPPTTKIARSAGPTGTTLGIMMPVKKGNYWKVTGASVVYWTPLGS